LEEQDEDDDITLAECLTKMKEGKSIPRGDGNDRDNNEGGVGEANASTKNDCV
ncbi:hypothetical protein KI387_009393, partial [Taxus chinensis]